MTDLINHPPHYTSHPSGVECLTVTRHMGFNLGNAVKYIWRADLKGAALDDLRKAAFYIADEIKRREDAAKPTGFHPDFAGVSDCPKCGKFIEHGHECKSALVQL